MPSVAPNYRATGGPVRLKRFISGSFCLRSAIPEREQKKHEDDEGGEQSMKGTLRDSLIKERLEERFVICWSKEHFSLKRTFRDSLVKGRLGV